MLPNTFSTWAAVPLASTYMPLGSVWVTVKPCPRSQSWTAVTLVLAGAYCSSNAWFVSHLP